MAQNGNPDRRDRLFNATHLNIAIDSDRPPPAASTFLLAIRQQTKTAWEAFEAAENRLITLDDDVHAEVLEFISSHRSATTAQLQVARARLTMRIYEPRITEAESCCYELDKSVGALEEAAVKEPRTVEAQATMKVDMEVIKSSLATTREIIHAAQAQLNGARSVLVRLGPA